MTSWINGIMALVSSEELAKDVASAEALLDRHQVGNMERYFLHQDDATIGSDRYDRKNYSRESIQGKTEKNENSCVEERGRTNSEEKQVDIKKDQRKSNSGVGKAARESRNRSRMQLTEGRGRLSVDEKRRKGSVSGKDLAFLPVGDVPAAELLVEFHKVSSKKTCC